MRWLAWLLTPLTLAAALWSGDLLRRALDDPLPPPAVAAEAPAADLALELPEPQPPRRWPSLFGTYTPPEPQPPRPPAPVVTVEPQPPAPPIESLGYALKGVVSDGDNRWAIVSHPTGDRLLRVGDTLQEGITVTAIDPGGLRLDNRGTEALLAFVD
ncbi:type II secretion system protein N [Maliponia aquimaris]|uniref:Type II secretion system protein GspC N-terminal domain-containing protein n=1 Tax=Maliponia aquimaris TaxID=1673631 RepID=A0A238KDC2_9RHOB|nr:type II secretion system protein N [Maliponia aquimaris]SMX40783.1 hypothetical protein MAA8898_02251 [Maliponia aquimaris]